MQQDIHLKRNVDLDEAGVKRVLKANDDMARKL